MRYALRACVFTFFFSILGSSRLDASQVTPLKGGVLRVAIVADPKNLDPMLGTTNIVSTVSQHFFETLYTVGENDKVVPLLADALPKVSEDRLQVRIALRRDVHFHDGNIMMAQDVIESLRRWMRLSVRGKGIADKVLSLKAISDFEIEFRLNQPLNQLPSLLAIFSSAAVIMPTYVLNDELKSYIGTGPYVYKERKVGEYIVLKRNLFYTSPATRTKSYANKRTAYIDEIRFIPVPRAFDRMEGLRSGKLDYADELPPAYLSALEKSGGLVYPEILESPGDTMLFFNTKQGLFSDRAMRQAVQAALNPKAMLQIAFGAQTQYSKAKSIYPAARVLPIYDPDGALYPTRYPWHHKIGTENYAMPDVTKSKLYAQQAQYDGRPIRILTSGQYYFHLRMALEAARQLKVAGFPSTMQIVEWPQLVEIRKDLSAWDIFFTHGPFPDSPTLSIYFNSAAAGRWENPEKENLTNAFNRETNVNRRIAIFTQLQNLIYSEVPVIKIGNFSQIAARNKRLYGFKPAIWPRFWNVWISEAAR